ncbi:MAG: class I SAM-dependent methyltransferase [Chitinophagaceae bacterium]|nr:MAG: class I SAM-dependent methyltransferase [Chitinophagaceae bacterium]
MDKKNTERFSNRADDYVKYRPGYPSEILQFLQEEQGLSTDKVIADIGAGTGIATAVFIRAGYRVFAVEPNQQMRDKAIEQLDDQPAFTAVDGTASATTLDDESVDFIIAAQAFHWFEPRATQKEFRRILRKNGLVALMWNQRLINTAFEKAYDALIARFGSNYVDQESRFNSTDLHDFYSPAVPVSQVFYNKQDFNFEALKGRLLSSSYMPVAGETDYEEMITALEQLFNDHQVGGTVRINYDCNLFVGKFN